MSEGEAAAPIGAALAAYTWAPGILPSSRSATLLKRDWLTPDTPSGVGSRRNPADASAALAAPEATTLRSTAAGRSTCAAVVAAGPGRLSSVYMSAAGVIPAIVDGPS